MQPELIFRLVNVYSIDKTEPKTSLSGHSSFVYSVVAFPDGSGAISTGEDGTMRVWSSTSPLPPYIHTNVRYRARPNHRSFLKFHLVISNRTRYERSKRLYRFFIKRRYYPILYQRRGVESTTSRKGGMG
jgi:WD40 repeat protein